MKDEMETGVRIAIFGNYGVFSPYESQDGSVGYTVQCVDPNDEPEDMGEIIGEFANREHAEFFASALDESEEDLRIEEKIGEPNKD